LFGKNEIVGEKYFKDAVDKIFVTSIFGVTLQGEGPYRGEPAMFVRLAKCNLACSFCDTFFDDGDWMTVAELDTKISKTISQHFQGDVPLWADVVYGGPGSDPVKKRDMVLVLTGGEPMLQKNIVPFLEHMNTQFAKTQIESNGTIVQNIPRETTLVVSPKCSEKNGRAVKYLEPRPEMLARADCLKFVMSADPDTPYNTVPEWAHRWKQETGKPVFVSPMNVYNDLPQKSKQLRAEKNQISMDERSTVDEVISFWQEGLLNMTANQANHEYAARYCATHGMILNLQIHLYASLA
jgi:7-carboxy-7-deazaguanine synthase